MASTTWTSFTVGDLIPSEVKTAVDVLDTAVTTTGKILEAVITLLDIAAQLSLDDIDLSTIAVKAAIAAIESALDDLKQPGLVHTLVVPVRLGSNETFYNTVAESFQDKGDIQRPLFDRTDAVAGVFIMYGASNPAALIDSLRSLQKLLKGFGADALDGNAYPLPKNLKAKIIKTPLQEAITNPEDVDFGKLLGTGEKPFSVLLTWQPKQGEYIFESLSSNFTLDKMVVLRSEERFDDTLPQSELERLVLDEYDYNAFTAAAASFCDRTVEERKTYYYAVGYRVSVDDIELKNFFISDVVEIKIEPRTFASTRGTPPDWSTPANPFLAIPGFAEAITEIEIFLARLESSTEGNATQFKKYVAFLRKLITHNLAEVQRIVRLIDRAVDLLDEIDLGAHAMAFSGVGGNDLALSSLRAGLNATTDPNRPAFDPLPGTLLSPDYVGGIVLMAGGPSPGAFATAKTFFDLLSTSPNIAGLPEAFATLDGVVQSNVQKTKESMDNFFADMTEKDPEAVVETDASLLTEEQDPPEQVPVLVDPFAENEHDVTLIENF